MRWAIYLVNLCVRYQRAANQMHIQNLKHRCERRPIVFSDCNEALFNRIWTTNFFPISWKLAQTLAFLKLQKLGINPEEYRPISLTRCTCKLMERMVKTLLMWNIEKRAIFNPNQYGLRRGRSTVDVLAKVDQCLR